MSEIQWEVLRVDRRQTGDYYVLNVIGKRDHMITVKHRSGVSTRGDLLAGPPYVCLTCDINHCAHTKFVDGVIRRGEAPAADAPAPTDADFSPLTP